MILQLRCCCNAGKLLGTIEVPGNAYEGMQVPYATPQGVIALQVGMIYNSWHREGRLAVKSMDTPIEVLRTIPSFREAHYEDSQAPR